MKCFNSVIHCIPYIFLVVLLFILTACHAGTSYPSPYISSSGSTLYNNTSASSDLLSFDFLSDSSSSLQSEDSNAGVSSTGSSTALSRSDVISSLDSSSIEIKYEKPLPPDIDLKPEGSLMQISQAANKDKLVSFGVEWDPFLWMPYNTKFGIDEADWKLITSRVIELGIDRVRIGWQPVYHEFMNDNNDPAKTDLDMFFLNENNQELASLRRQLDFCQKNGIKATIFFWGPTNQSWIGSKYSGNWWNAPYSDEEYAENISVLLKFLIVTCKYSVVDEICPFGEPSLGYYNKSGNVVFTEYAEMMRTLDARLKKDGIRDKIKLVASDDSSGRAGVGTGYLNGLPWFEDSVKALSDIGQVFSTHSYRFVLKDTNEDIRSDMKVYYDMLKKYAPDAPLMIHEFGTANVAGAYHVTDLESYDRALLLPKFAINLLNAGGAGASYWTMFDQLYYEGPVKDAIMATGLWAFKTEGWRIRRMYHSWGLVCKYTSPESAIYAGQSDDSDLCIVGLKDKEGLATYLIVNSGITAKQFTINTPVTKRAFFDVFVFDKIKAASKSDKLTGSSQRIPCSRNVMVADIGPESFIVLREAGLEPIG